MLIAAGLLIWAIVLTVTLALCKAASESDRQAQAYFKEATNNPHGERSGAIDTP